jgi:nucleotide-binding universal stress UspA family protein
MPTDPLNVHKVLVPLDFSDPSLQALQYARRFAEPSKAELILLYVIEPVAYPAELGVVINLDADLAERALDDLLVQGLGRDLHVSVYLAAVREAAKGGSR